MQILAFLAAILNVKLEKRALNQLLDFSVIVIGSMLLKIPEVFPNIAHPKDTFGRLQ